MTQCTAPPNARAWTWTCSCGWTARARSKDAAEVARDDHVAWSRDRRQAELWAAANGVMFEPGPSPPHDPHE